MIFFFFENANLMFDIIVRCIRRIQNDIIDNFLTNFKKNRRKLSGWPLKKI